MHRNIFLLMIIVVLCFSMISCSFIENELVGYGSLEYINDDGKSGYVYQNKKYYANYIFNVTRSDSIYDEDDIKIAGDVFSDFYSYTADDPIYIYSISKGLIVYLREDYDYRSDHFIIEGTDSSFLFSEAIANQPSVQYDGFKTYPIKTSVYIHSETYPKIRAHILVFLEDGKWYALFEGFDAYLLSDEFVDMLIENEIISE